MYLTDLSFIEEGALDITEHGLINFCKMRMVSLFRFMIRFRLAGSCSHGNTTVYTDALYDRASTGGCRLSVGPNAVVE